VVELLDFCIGPHQRAQTVPKASKRILINFTKNSDYEKVIFV
jgi:hypothetical protein